MTPAHHPVAWVVRLHSLKVGEEEIFEIRSVPTASLIFSRACECYINRRKGTTLRGHGSPGRPAGPIPAAHMRLRSYDSVAIAASYASRAANAAVARAPILTAMATISSLGASNEKRVISYGLYGSASRYTIGVLRNAELAPTVYPGWTVSASFVAITCLYAS